MTLVGPPSTFTGGSRPGVSTAVMATWKYSVADVTTKRTPAGTMAACHMGTPFFHETALAAAAAPEAATEPDILGECKSRRIAGPIK